MMNMQTTIHNTIFSDCPMTDCAAGLHAAIMEWAGFADAVELTYFAELAELTEKWTPGKVKLTENGFCLPADLHLYTEHDV